MVDSKQQWKAWLYLAPAIFLLLIFTVWPMINTVRMAFLEGYSGLQAAGGATFKFGLGNFAKVLKYGTMFKQGLECTVLLSACTVLFGFIIAMLLALMMLSNVYPLHFLAKTKCKSEKTQDLMIWLSKFNPLKFIASVYVQFVRCTPMLV